MYAKKKPRGGRRSQLKIILGNVFFFIRIHFYQTLAGPTCVLKFNWNIQHMEQFSANSREQLNKLLWLLESRNKHTNKMVCRAFTPDSSHARLRTAINIVMVTTERSPIKTCIAKHRHWIACICASKLLLLLSFTHV